MSSAALLLVLALSALAASRPGPPTPSGPGGVAPSAALSAPWVPSPPSPPANQEVDEAADLFRRAEEAIRARRYQRGLELYADLAKRFPDRVEGRVARARTAPTALLGVNDEVRTGPSSNRLDLVVMGDGFAARDIDQRAFDELCAAVPGWLAGEPTLAAYLPYVNVQRVNLASADGDFDAHEHEFDTALGGHSLGHADGAVGLKGERVQTWLQEVDEHDDLVLAIVRKGKTGRGTGSTAVVCGRACAGCWRELGRALAGLALETPRPSYGPGHRETPLAPAPNVAASPDDQALPWRHWIEATAPGIGAVPGADGRMHGAWRPSESCVMGDGDRFCVVCREALVLALHRHVDPIDACSPTPWPDRVSHGDRVPGDLDRRGPLRFEVRTMRPRTHSLEVSWWILDESRVPAPAGPLVSGATGDRRMRGPLRPIATAPVEVAFADGSGVATLELTGQELGPGRHCVIARVRDPLGPALPESEGSAADDAAAGILEASTAAARRLPEGAPWVLRDEHGLLHSERRWWVGE